MVLNCTRSLTSKKVTVEEIETSTENVILLTITIFQSVEALLTSIRESKREDQSKSSKVTQRESSPPKIP